MTTFALITNATEARKLNAVLNSKVEAKRNVKSHKFLRKTAKEIRKAARQGRCGVTVMMPADANWQTIIHSLATGGYTVHQDFCTSPKLVVCW